jgi:hypothetical protein
MMTEVEDKRLAETLRLILAKRTTFNNHLEVAQEADNINRPDVGRWIRDNPWKFNIWMSVYASAYAVPEIEDDWE